MLNRNIIFGLALLFFFFVVLLKGPWITFVTFAYLCFLFLWVSLAKKMQIPVVVSLVIFVFIHVFGSFLPINRAYSLLYSTGLVVIGVSVFSYKTVWAESKSVYERLSQVSFFDSFAIFLFLIPILCYGVSTNEGFYSLDTLHHFYEVSFGRSYQYGIFNAHDLSFFLKPARFHFLGTRMAEFLSVLWHIPLEQSASYGVLIFYFPILIFVTISIMKSIGIYVPFAVLLAFPLFGLKSSFWFPTQSVLLATFTLLSSVWAFLNRHRFLLCFLCIVLVLAKVSFFMVLFGALGLVFLKRPSARVFLLLVLLFVAFIGLYSLFLSGAHGHILWMHFPGSLLWLVLHKKWVLLCSIIGVLGFAGYRFLQMSKESPLLFPTALALSGVLGVLAVVEVTSGDHLQFLKAAGIPAVISLWVLPAPFNLDRMKRIGFYGVSVIGGVLFVISFYRMVQLSYPLLSRDNIRTYSYLSQETTNRDVVLHGKHYEVSLGYCADKGARDLLWFSRTGFERSALSGAQFLDESVKWKGIVMEKTLPLRVAQTILFYENFVQLSDESLVRIGQFRSDWFGYKQPLSISEQSGKEAWLLQHFGFGRQWYYPNQMDALNRQIRTLLDQSFDQLLVGPEFLKFYRISYIVLEDGDEPTPALLELADPVFETSTTMVLKVKDLP